MEKPNTNYFYEYKVVETPHYYMRFKNGKYLITEELSVDEFIVKVHIE